MSEKIPKRRGVGGVEGMGMWAGAFKSQKRFGFGSKSIGVRSSNAAIRELLRNGGLWGQFLNIWSKQKSGVFK